MSDSYNEVLVLIYSVWLSLNTVPSVVVKLLYFGLICLKDVVVEMSCALLRCNFANFCLVVIFFKKQNTHSFNPF